MKTTISSEIQQLAYDSYRAVRQKSAKNEPIALLHIADEYSFIVFGAETAIPDRCWLFDIGRLKTTRDFFRHNLPTPAEVEYAIQVVEDEVMPLHKLIPPGCGLYTTDTSILKIAQQTVSSHHSVGVVLARTEMEQVFGRLAAIISGRPANQDILPITNTFAATLIILREVMHHLGFVNITIFD